MAPSRCLIRYAVAALLLFWLLGSRVSLASERMSLDGCSIVMDSDQPSYVQHAVQDLRNYLREITGREPPLATAPVGAARTSIVLGAAQWQRICGRGLPVEKLDAEGYALKTVGEGGKQYLLAAGSTALGTKYAVAAVMKSIRADGKSAFLDAPVDFVSRPAFAKRGMHFNGWAFHSPYTFRSWKEQEWQRYLDLLAYQGVNLFYLWPFIEIMPVPLSDEDRQYLDECRRVVDYAQTKHGMEVWIMQCTNRVAKDRCGIADPRLRPYWRPRQEDLNPGNPQHFQAIMDSREGLYRILDNVDGVCNIDSDPGHYTGSPLSDYLKVLQGCRALLDRHNVHGKQAKLVNWMWYGWGLPPIQSFDPRHQDATLRVLKQQLAEPWWLINGRFEYLPLCRQQGVLEKTLLLPYGVIEGEPSYPGTNVDIDAIRAAFDSHLVKYPELRGVMGNVQTPLLQLPHVYYFSSAIWDLDYRKRSEKEVLMELATHLYPEHSQLIADCYLGLKAADPTRIEVLATQLERLIAQDKLGRLGIFGRKLFPDSHIVARSLLLQLRLRAARELLLQKARLSTAPTACTELVRNYFDAYLAWDTAHGWHCLWGWNQWPLGTFTWDDRFPPLAAALRRAMGSEAVVDSCFRQIGAPLMEKYGKKPVEEGCIAPLKKAILDAASVDSLAQKAKASASVVPDPLRYPAGAANDGMLATLYWPGALVENNREWLQLTWDRPQTFQKVIVRFLQHPSMHGRTIHLQREASTGKWEDLATAVIPSDAKARHAVAEFRLPAPATVDKIRVVNLLDLFEIEVY